MIKPQSDPPSGPARSSPSRLEDELCVHLEAIPTSAKRIAFVALFLSRVEQLRMAAAIAAAADLVSRRDNLCGRARTQTASRARALVEYGRIGVIPLRDVPLPRAGPRLKSLLAGAVCKANLARASAARSRALGGARGGPKPKPSRRLSLAFSRLVREAEAGDPLAAEKLDQMVEILAADAPRAHVSTSEGLPGEPDANA